MKGPIITIGTFDGVHLGHQALLSTTIREARKRKLRSLAIAFRVPPRMILDQRQPRAILSTPAEKERLMQRAGIDAVRFLTFNRKLASLRPFHFFRDVLIRKFRARGLVVGADFRFGMDRSAGALELVKWGQEFEIPVWVVPAVKQGRLVVSSSVIRALLGANKLKPAVGLLGHGYLLEGRVVRGRRLGRRLGFPTANIRVEPGKILPEGVFAIRGGSASIRKKRRVWTGVCNIGRRPTVSAGGRISVEAHFFNRVGNLAGKTIWIELLHRLRGERKFSTIGALRRTINKDVSDAREKLRKTAFLYRLGEN